MRPLYFPWDDITRGESYDRTDTLLTANRQLKDLTGLSAKLHVREADVDAGGALLLELTSEPGGGILLGGSAGTVRVQVTPAQSGAMNLGADRRAFYQLWFTQGTKTWCEWEGPFVLGARFVS